MTATVLPRSAPPMTSNGSALPVPAATGDLTHTRAAPAGFLGTGWAWPLATDATGCIAMVDGAAELEQAMYLILATTPGERPMRPEFGARLQDFLFASADATTAALIAGEVRAALRRWEPRVDVQDVIVTADPDDPATLWIDVRYLVLQTYDRRNLVVPFYTIPEEG